jgi:putative tryptophan/tyrosine transport system substrate-binding protein
MNRRDFTLLLGTAVFSNHGIAEEPRRQHKLVIIDPSAAVEEMREAGVNPNFHAFFIELRRLGYIEGENLTVHRYSAGGRNVYRDLANKALSLGPDVILAVSNGVVRAAREVTADTPIISIMTDPVSQGFVASLGAPGSNISGVASDAGFEVWEKRLQFIKELVPGASRVSFLTPTFGPSPFLETPYGRAVQEMAKHANMQLSIAALQPPVDQVEYRRVFEQIVRFTDILLVNEGPHNWANRRLIVELTGNIPAMYPWREYIEAGGLMAYPVELETLFQYMAGQVASIFSGTKVGEIPVYQARTFKLIINLRAAKALGLSVPPSLLARVDEVIE